jgi:hypothetical protein
MIPGPNLSPTRDRLDPVIVGAVLDLLRSPSAVRAFARLHVDPRLTGLSREPFNVR